MELLIPLIPALAAILLLLCVLDANDPLFKMGSPGMSLRDYFGAAALPAVISECVALAQISLESGSPSLIAKSAYAIADAMLAERDKR